MRNRQKSETCIMILLLAMSLVAVAPIINSENTTVVSMDKVNIPKGGSDWGLLTVSDVSNLGSCDVTLSWDPDVVTVTDVNDSDFDSMEYYVDDTAGVLSADAFSYDTMSGDFTIAKVTFEPASGASVGDECDLEIINSQLLTAESSDPSEIYHDRQNGTAIITKSSSDDDDDDGGLPPAEPTNIPPVANASASQTSGFVGESINFDGSLSADSDGTIDLYEWDWDDDGAYDASSASISATHSFNAADTYAVTLRVTDDGGITDEDTVDVVITIANNPPTKPTVNGPTTGNKNTAYDYTAVSTDADDDTIQYTFNWDDSSANTVTDFLSSGTAATQTHNWAAPGIYEISVKAYDNETDSAATKLTVLIDTHWVKDIGYLIDDDSDGNYDAFYSNSTKNQTDINKQDDSTYLIDNDGDGDWDYVYNIKAGIFTECTSEKTSENNAIWYALGVGILLAIIVLIIIFLVVNVKRKTIKSKTKIQAKKKIKK